MLIDECVICLLMSVLYAYKWMWYRLINECVICLLMSVLYDYKRVCYMLINECVICSSMSVLYIGYLPYDGRCDFSSLFFIQFEILETSCLTCPFVK